MKSKGTQRKPRECGIEIGMLPPGPTNSLIDIPGVRVGHSTLNYVARNTVACTGVTAIWPAEGDLVMDPVPGGSFVLNGFGEITGRTVVDEWGLISTPILLTSTMGVGIVYHAVQKYMCEKHPELGISELVIPVVAECDDSFLNDSRCFHIKEEHVFCALDDTGITVEEGCVGAGTGMQCFQFKGGIGSASRRIDGYTVGILTLNNFGSRDSLAIRGVPVGRLLTDNMPVGKAPDYWGESGNGGSCIVVVGTDAPLSNHQIAKLAKRSALGLARVGSVGANCSGEIMLAFSTANRRHVSTPGLRTIDMVNDRNIDGIYQAVVEATEESVVNALFAATTTVGRDGNTLYALPVERTLKIMRDYGAVL